MKISNKYKLIHIHIPKTAGSMIANAFQDELKLDPNGVYGERNNHESAYQVKHRRGDWSEYRKFTVVRNPWQAELSHFFYLKDIWITYFEGEHRSKTLRQIYYKEGAVCEQDFSGFLKNHKKANIRAEKEIDWYFNMRFRDNGHKYPDSYSRFIFDDDTDELLIDDVIRFERINKDWLCFCEKNKITDKNIIEYPSQNTDNSTIHNHYREYYTQKWMIDLVHERHKDYIEYFNYEF
mgnify:FL=1